MLHTYVASVTTGTNCSIPVWKPLRIWTLNSDTYLRLLTRKRFHHENKSLFYTESNCHISSELIMITSYNVNSWLRFWIPFSSTPNWMHLCHKSTCQTSNTSPSVYIWNRFSSGMPVDNSTFKRVSLPRFSLLELVEFEDVLYAKPGSM